MNIDNFVNFIKKNYKLAIPVILMFVLFLSFIIYYFISKTTIFNSVEKVKVYQFFTSDKTEYDLEISKNRKGVISDLYPVSISVVYDSTPIFESDNKNVVIFPKRMSVVAPVMNCSEYLADEFSYIEFENKRYNLVTNGFNSALGHYFLYDGANLYFFIENVTLIIGDKRIELSPYSYIVANNKKISYYNREKDEFVVINDDSYGSYIYNDYYKVYVVGDYIDMASEKVLLTTDLDTLMKIKEMKRTLIDE